MGVELPWIFLFNHCYCKIADLVRRKGRFETKKQKDVRHDGINIVPKNNVSAVLILKCQSLTRKVTILLQFF